MGSAMVARLKERKWRVETYDISGKGTAKSIEELVGKLAKPRIVWMMVPSRTVESVSENLIPLLQKGDIVIDGGNSFYKDSIERARKLARKGIYFLDAGVSGGPQGARQGACLMIGGSKLIYQRLEFLFKDVAVPGGFGYMGNSGAGHFVKMVHNGIEYGMMQAIAEGFTVMKKAPFKLHMRNIAKIYNHGSVVESRLMDWLEKAFQNYGENLKEVSGSVAHTGEGEWTIQTAKKFGVSVPAIKAAFDFRLQSAKKPSYTGKILTMLRNQFGGHPIK